MGKGRRKAKTGDKALYKSRGKQDDRPNDDDDDPMYTKVDRFHNAREDFLKLDQNVDSDSEDEEQEEAVMDLGVDASSDEDSESAGGQHDLDHGAAEQDSEDEDVSSSEEEKGLSDSDESEEMQVQDIRDWGKKKSDYYNGDTADLEIGQEEDDAFVEEEAAKELQAARLAEMDEKDFLPSDDDSEEETTDNVNAARDASKLSTKEKRKLLDKMHPELLPLVNHFSVPVEDLVNNTSVATNALLNGDKDTAKSVGATKAGQRYLLTKTLLQSSMALNLALFLLLKREYSSNPDVDASVMHSHPIMSRLQKLNKLMHSLEDTVENRVPGLREQLENLVKAAALMQDGVDDSESSEEEQEASVEDESAEDDEQLLDDEPATPELSKEQIARNKRKAQARERRVINDARFSLRPGEFVVEDSEKRGKRRPAPMEDYGDEGADLGKAAAVSLASTLNSIEQRAASKKKQKPSVHTESIDEHEGPDDELRRGLEMMEAELGKMSDEGEENDGADEMSDEGDNDFYGLMQKKSKTRKEVRKEMYKVAPKYPRLEEEVDGERKISRQILKNRGLVAHKAKINRNPRVKKREQYRKALIRRKGTVRDVRTDEGHKYGGEETGIKTSVSRSRKLKS